MDGTLIIGVYISQTSLPRLLYTTLPQLYNFVDSLYNACTIQQLRRLSVQRLHNSTTSSTLCTTLAQLNNFVDYLYNASTTIKHIIILVFSLIALPSQNKIDRNVSEVSSSIQYGYRKSGTRARMLSPTFPHWNSKNKGRRRNAGRRQAEELSGHEAKKSPDLFVACAHRPHGVATLLPEAADDFINKPNTSPMIDALLQWGSITRKSSVPEELITDDMPVG